MKIAILTDTPPGPGSGGAGRVANLLLSALRARGHEVVQKDALSTMMETRSLEQLKGSHDTRGRVERQDHARVRRKLVSAVAPLAMPEYLIRRVLALLPASETIFNFHEVWLWGLPDSTSEILSRSVFTIHDYWPFCVRRNRVDVFDRQCARGDFVRCFLCQNVRPLPPTSINPLRPQVWYRKTKSTLAGSAAVVVPSEYMRDFLLAHDLDEENVSLIRNGIDTSLFQPPKHDYESRDIVLFVARPERLKGLDLVLRQNARYPLRYRIVVVGQDGVSQGNVEYLPRVSDKQLVRLYGRARAVVVPSLWPENCSMVILEAMGCGTPVIASNLGGNRELVRPGKNGWLFDPSDKSELGETLGLLADTKLVQKLGSAGRKLAEEQFSLKRFITEYERLFAEILDER